MSEWPPPPSSLASPVLHLDQDFELIAEVTSQPTQPLVRTSA